MRMKPADLVWLLGCTAQGDRDRFAELYRATSLKLYGIVFRILRQQELAEDVLQDVYVRIWDHAADYDPAKASAIAWMAAIARNRSLDEIRRRGLAIASDDLTKLEIADHAPSPEDNAELSDELRRLERCLDGLDKPRREAIKLAYLEGYSRQELAERFDQPVGTIKTWLHRGLIQLKNCLGS
jgi:RNA polymerase sigma-70 factor, ECF subfamily